MQHSMGGRRRRGRGRGETKSEPEFETESHSQSPGEKRDGDGDGDGRSQLTSAMEAKAKSFLHYNTIQWNDSSNEKDAYKDKRSMRCPRLRLHFIAFAKRGNFRAENRSRQQQPKMSNKTSEKAPSRRWACPTSSYPVNTKRELREFSKRS